MRNSLIIALLLTGAVWVGIATQPRPAAADDEKPPRTVLVVYDLRDYLEAIQDYPLNPPPTPPPATQPAAPNAGAVNLNVFGRPSGPPGSQEELLDEVERLIDSTVQPDTWRDNGGSAGSTFHLDGKLYVTQTPDAQAQVKALLAQVTGDAKRTVHLTASWLLLSDNELAALREPAKAGEDAAIVRLDDAAMQKAKPVARARLLCLDGQTVHITAGAGRMKLQVNPTLSAKKGQVILDVLNEVGGAGAPTTRPGGDVHLTEVQRFHTTARIPLGADVVIGGMTVQAGAGGKPGRELYLVVRVDAE